MATCADCIYYTELVPGDLGYSADEVRGRCSFCPPWPTGDYREELAQWSIVLGSHEDCALCRCRGCNGQPSPKTYFILQENGDKLLQENSDGLLRE